MKTIDYDEAEDILFVHEGFKADERFKGNIDLGNLIFDVSTKGRVVGVEIMNATEFFKGLGLDPKLLNSISDFSIKSRVTREYLIVFLNIKAKKVDVKIPIPVALATPA